MRKLEIIAVLVSMVAVVPHVPAQERARPNRYLRFGAYDGIPSGPQVIPEYEFVTRFVGWITITNGSSVGPTYRVSTVRGVSWRDFLHLEIRHDGESAESWLELTFAVDTSYSGLARGQSPHKVRRWEKTEKLHPPTELRPDSSVLIPFEVRLRDGCPLRLGTYEVVASFDPAIARVPELAWIARLPPPPEPAVWRVGLTSEEAAMPRHRFELFRRGLPKVPRTRAELVRLLRAFWVAEHEKDPSNDYALYQVISATEDWDEIERLLERAIAWLEAGGRFSSKELTQSSKPQIERVRGALDQFRQARVEGKSPSSWSVGLLPEFRWSFLPGTRANDHIVRYPLPPKIYPSTCQLPMQPLE